MKNNELSSKIFLDVTTKLGELNNSGQLEDPHLNFALHEYLKFNNPSAIIQLIETNPDFLDWLELEHEKLLQNQEENPYYPFPLQEEAAQLTGSIPIGIINEHGNILYLDHDEDLTQNLQMYGMPGRGKSSKIRQIILSLLDIPDRQFNIIIIDPKADYLHVATNYDFKIITKQNITYNHWQPPGKEDPLDYTSSAVEIFCAENYFFDLGKRIIEEALIDCYKNMPRKNGRPIYPNYSQLTAKALEKIFEYRETTKGGSNFHDFAIKLQMRLNQYIETKEMFNCHFGYPTKFYIDNDLILTDINDIPSYMLRQYLIGTWHKLFRYNLKNNRRGQSLRTLFICDEAYLLFDSERDKNQYESNEMLNMLLRQGRDPGINWIISAQEPSSITQSFRNNAATTIAFPVQAQELKETKDIMNLTDEQTHYIPKLPQKFTGIIRTHKYKKPFIFQMPEPDFPTQPTKEEIQKINEQRLNRFKEAVRKENSIQTEVTMAITKKEAKSKEQEKKAQLEKQAEKLSKPLIAILKETPFIPFSKIQDITGLDNKKLNLALDWMKKENICEEVPCITAKNAKPSRFFPLTKKGEGKIAPSHFKHEFYKKIIHDWLERNYKKASYEYPKGSPEGIDVAAIHEVTDDLIAYEVTLHFKNLVDNILKCQRLKAKKIYIVCENKTQISFAKKTISKNLGSIPKEVEHIKITHFFE